MLDDQFATAAQQIAARDSGNYPALPDILARLCN